MLSLKLIKGHDIDPLDIPSMKHSHSCTNLSRTTTSHFSFPKTTTSSSFFSIYQRSQIHKAPHYLQLQNKIHQLTKRIKFNRKEMINSIHINSMKDSLKQKYNSLYLTNSRHSNSNSYIDESYTKIKSERNYSIVPYDSYIKDKMSLNVGMLFHKGKSTYEYIKNLNDVFVLKKCFLSKKEKYLQLKEDKESLISEIESYEQRLKFNKQLLTKAYETVFGKYLHFLQAKILDERITYDALRCHKNKLIFDINKLKVSIFNTKQKINELVDIRNFLIKVKEHKSVHSLFITEQLKETSYDNSVCYLNRQHLPMFTSPQEFMTNINTFESSNLQLLSKFNQLSHEVHQLKEELQQMKLKVNAKETTLYNEISHKQQTLNSIINTNQKLTTQYNTLLSSIRRVPLNNQTNILNNNNTNNKLIKKEMLNITNRDNLVILKYKQQQKKYPLYNTVLFYTLLKNVKHLLSLKVINTNMFIELELFRSKDDLDKCMTFVPKEDDKEKLFTFIVKLLKIYEIACLNVVDKHHRLLNNKMIHDKMMKLIMNQQTQNKIKRAVEQRLILEKKKEFIKNKIIEKAMKSFIKPKKKVMDKYKQCTFKLNNEGEKEATKSIVDNSIPTLHDYIDIY